MESNLVDRNHGFSYGRSEHTITDVEENDFPVYTEISYARSCIDTAVIGRPYACIAMHPHEELVIMEVLLQHPERTLPEIIQEVYQETGSEYACSTLHYYLKRNNITRKKVGLFYNVVPIVIIITLRLHACVLFKAKLICLAS